MGLKIHRESSDGNETIYVEGAIDETADIAALFRDVPPRAVFNLAKVSRINSVGINRWIPAVTACAESRDITFTALPYCMVMQANCVSNLFGSAKAISCLSPYFCTKCEQRIDVLVTREEAKAAHPNPPRKTCAKCNQTLALDELESYFLFLVS